MSQNVRFKEQKLGLPAEDVEAAGVEAAGVAAAGGEAAWVEAAAPEVMLDDGQVNVLEAGMEVVIEPREVLETESEQCRCHCQDVENVGKIFSSILSAKYKNLSNPVL